MKKILVTGGAGFIGSHLVEKLLAENAWHVTVVDNFNDFYAPSIKRANVAAFLGNPQTSIEQGIKKFVDWFMQQKNPNIDITPRKKEELIFTPLV